MTDADAELIERHLAGALAPHAEQIRAHVRPSLRLRRCGDGSPVGRIGGLPALPAGTAWPHWNDTPLTFLVEIDLAALPAGGPLPATGHLAFFYAGDPEDQPWGFSPEDAGSARVLFTAAEATRIPLEPPGPPQENRYGEGELFATIELTLPPVESSEGLEVDDEDAYCQLIDDLLEAHDDDAGQHRLLGHPDAIQGDMQLEVQMVTNGIDAGDETGYEDPRLEALRPGAGAWRLLLQLDSEDEPAEVSWGDFGSLYFWIHERDLARGDFSAVWTVLQCT